MKKQTKIHLGARLGTTSARLAAVLLCALLLASCMGMETEVKIAKDGSGSLVARYRLSEDLVAFGELEANKDLLPVPLSEEDLRKSLSGAKGLSLKSWSSGKDSGDLLITATIAFDSLDSLVLYLDPQGKLASHEGSADLHTIRFNLGDAVPTLDKEMRDAAREAFAPYRFSFVFDLPSPPKDASSSDPAIAVLREARRVRFEGKMSDIVTLEKAPSLSLSW